MAGIESKTFKAINEIEDEITRQGGFIFNGRVSEIIQKNKVFDKKQIKFVMDKVGVDNTKVRKFIYEQVELGRSRSKLRKMMK